MKKKAKRHDVKGNRPEHSAPAEQFYDRREASQYSQNARMTQIQTNLAKRALHLLHLPPKTPALLLELGCGTGFGGRVIEKSGHAWIGTDISADMLAAGRRPAAHSDHICHDMGCFLPFRNGMFDGAISISAVQWLCVATKPEHDPEWRLRAFLHGLRRSLRRGARAVLQFYPEDVSQMEMLKAAALDCNFTGSLVTDYPVSEAAKKFFLVLTSPSQQPQKRLPSAGASKDTKRAKKRRRT